MNWLLLCRMLGLLAMLVGGSMVFSLPWAFPLCGQTTEFEARGFWGIVLAIVCSVACGGSLYIVGRKETGAILRKEALAIVGLGWFLAGVLGSLPFLFSATMRDETVSMSIADCLFESISGFTTTGASVLTQLQDSQLVPRCVLFWRSFTHWLGGVGIIVLFVAILGQLGAGGKALVRREIPGPISEAVRPRVRETAIVMWSIYVGFSIVLTLILMLEGMSLYDSLCHTFGTMATGGFSTYNESISHFDSPLIEGTLILFMIAAGTNFSLYYLALRHNGAQGSHRPWGRFYRFVRDPEFRIYVSLLAAATVLLMISLLWNGNYDHIPSVLRPAVVLRHAAFTSVSIMTTTGFGTEDFQQWSQFSKGLLLLLMFIGGSAGSTGGGIKVIRLILFIKIIRLEIEQAFRPNVVRPLKIFGSQTDSALRHEVLVYFSLLLIIFVSSWMILLAIVPDTQWNQEGTEAEKLLDCASAVAATLNNIGPGLGVLGPTSNYSGFTSLGKLLLTLLMLLGRLELFAILVLFVPSFWRSQ